MPDHRAALAGEVRLQRRRLGEGSLETFMRLYLPACCTEPFCNLHYDFFVELERVTRQRGQRLAIAAPRGHAKSSIVSLGFVLWCMLYKKEGLIVLVSATKEQAILLLAHVREQLERNERIRSDFPELCVFDARGPGRGARRRRPTPWRGNRLLLPNGCMLAAYGQGQGLRGARNGPHRPGLIICDDLEDLEGVLSEEQRAKLKDWFIRTLLQAGHTDTNVVVVGTILHHDALLARLTDGRSFPGWSADRYRAVERFCDDPRPWRRWTEIYRRDAEHAGRSGPEAALAFYKEHEAGMLAGARVLWPQRESYYDLMVMREREGEAAFQAEKQNEPLDPELCIFAGGKLRYWDDEFPDEEGLLARFGGRGYFYGACDPSLGRKSGGGDYSAIVILFRPKGRETCYVLAADIARRPPSQTVARILQYGKMYDLDGFAVESNQFQTLLVDDLEERAREEGVRLYVERVENRANKEARVAALEPAVSSGRVRFCRRHRLLTEQLEQFPTGRHDDGPDALEMAVGLASQGPGKGFSVQYF